MKDSIVFLWFSGIYLCRNISSNWNYFCACSFILFVILFCVLSETFFLGSISAVICMSERDNTFFLWCTEIHCCQDISSSWNYLSLFYFSLHKYFWIWIIKWVFFKFSDVIKFISATNFLHPLIISFNAVLFFFKFNYFRYFSQNYPKKYLCRDLYCSNIFPYCIS